MRRTSGAALIAAGLMVSAIPAAFAQGSPNSPGGGVAINPDGTPQGGSGQYQAAPIGGHTSTSTTVDALAVPPARVPGGSPNSPGGGVAINPDGTPQGGSGQYQAAPIGGHSPYSTTVTTTGSVPPTVAPDAVVVVPPSR